MDGVDIGRAFYPVAAMLNHECLPNVAWTTSSHSNAVIVCTATRDISEGEELCISYVNPKRLDSTDVN